MNSILEKGNTFKLDNPPSVTAKKNNYENFLVPFCTDKTMFLHPRYIFFFIMI